LVKEKRIVCVREMLKGARRKSKGEVKKKRGGVPIPQKKKKGSEGSGGGS